MASDYGKAILGRQLRYVSASAIAAFDPTQEGGCNTRWFFEKIEGKKPPETKAQNTGKETHEQLEHYLKTGELTIGPVIVPGRHFIPTPGPDLIVEEGFGDYKKALAMRELVLNGKASPDSVREYAIAPAGVPAVGAMDLRHRRGVWLTGGGVLTVEADPLHTAEIVDWKTSSDILQYAKRDAELPDTVQMPLYAKATKFVWPDLVAVRVSHGTFGTRRREATKSSYLMSIDLIDRRWSHIEETVEKMVRVARLDDASQTDFNTDACGAYRGCPHMPYCPRPKGYVSELFSIGKKGASTMNESLFGNGSPTNGAGTTASMPASTAGSLFSSVPTAAPPPVPTVVMTEEQRQAKIATENARLLAEDAAMMQAKAVAVAQVAPAPAISYGFCSSCGTSLNANNASRTPSGSTIHIGCTAGMTVAPPPVPAAPPVPAVPHIAAVNPVDSPPFDLAAAAEPLPPEAIAAIQDPELKAKVEQHAKIHAEAAAAAPAAKEKTTGRCTMGGQSVLLTPAEIARRKWICPTCSAERRIRDADFTSDFKSFNVPSHNRAKGGEAPAAAPAVLTVPAVPVVAPAIAAPPPIPVQVAPSVPPPVMIAPPIPSDAMAVAPPAVPSVPTPVPVQPTTYPGSVVPMSSAARLFAAKSILDSSSPSEGKALYAIAHALIAIAERP